MIQPINRFVANYLIKKLAEFKSVEAKISINEPTGDFFYDPWKMKPEFIGTEFEEVLSVLPSPIGEARIITLASGQCYFSHSDIDDRYHLNITGDCASLVDLENGQTYFLKADGIWYEMNAGILHSAANYGQYNRKQLVVRKLLQRNKIKSPVKVLITPKGPNSRFVFDNTISPWLNSANKAGIISNFQYDSSSVCLQVEKEFKNELEKIIPLDFEYKFDY